MNALPRLKLPWRWIEIDPFVILICGKYEHWICKEDGHFARIARRHGAIAE